MGLDEHVCPQCGSSLVYDAGLDSYYCSVCSEYYYSTEFEEHEENQFTGLYMEIQCKMCGKNTVVSKSFNYDVCPFCYNNLIDIVDGVFGFKAQLIAHFKGSKEAFMKSFFANAKNEGVPNEILANLNTDSLKGIFIPFYHYTIENKADCFMQTKESGGKRDADEYFFQKLSYMDESDVLVDATKFVPNEVIEDIGEFDFKHLDMFFAKHLEDYYTLRQSLSDTDVWKELTKIIEKHTQNEIERYKDKDEDVKEVKVFNKLRNLSRRVVLLPFWTFDFTIDGEPHILFINGQTGKMASDLHFEQKKAKQGLFSKNKDTNKQVVVKYREKVKHEDFRSNLEYMNELNKYAVNKNDRSAEIRKVR